MSYTRKKWADGEVITAEALNNIEEGVKEANESVNRKATESAEINDSGIVEFKNAAGVVLYTLDLSNLSMDTYGDIVLSLDALALTEGETGTFAVNLSAAPSTGNQVVYIAVNDETRLTVTPNALTFTGANFATPQTVTVETAEDEDYDNNAGVITLTSQKYSKQITVKIKDNDEVQPITDGLTLYFNLRNGDLTDSVGGVTATNGGTLSDSGVELESVSTKFQFVYPVQNENIPNGFTLEWACSGLSNWKGAGNGHGNGYAFKAQFYGTGSGTSIDQFGAGFAYTDTTGSTISTYGIDSENNLLKTLDYDGEHHYALVYNPDGSASAYIDGVVSGTRDIPTDFSHYNANGNITFKNPYDSIGDVKYPIILSEVRIYERALSADEVKANYNATVQHQQIANF